MSRFHFVYAALFVSFLPAWSHDFSWTDARFRVQGENFSLELVCDLDALANGHGAQGDSFIDAYLLRGLPASEQALRHDKLVDWFQRRMRVRFDGEPAPFEVFFPEKGLAKADDQPFFGILMRLEGLVPEGAQNFSINATRALPALRLSLLDGNDQPLGEPIPIPSGQRSETFSLNDLMATSVVDTMRRYMGLGFFHIIPLGPDHILFVLGLFLFCKKLKPLLIQVTAFTVAHTLTLGLAMAGWFTLPARPVEVLIAASIVYVAAENCFSQKLKTHRVVIVFLFGLLHGLGFAGVLTELGVPKASFVAALLAFNFGVELGQLLVITVAFALLGWWRNSPHYHNRIVRPLSVGIGCVALYWVFERLL